MNRRYARMSDTEYDALIASLDAKRQQYVRIDEAAELCGCSRTTLWRLRLRDKDFPPATRNGRGHQLFRMTEVAAWAEARRAKIKERGSSGSPALPGGP